MSKQPMGKTLLRNVIRHTDAHNKIQEEAEMWKMRDWETQLSRNKPLSDTDSMRGRMRCDQERDQTRGLSHSRQQVSEHDDREARYWTRKLYDFEANDPDRWGHSGFKELYPEEFESDDFSEKASPTKKMRHHKKSRFAMETCLSRRSKKSSRKKKKKKMKDEEKKRKKAKCSSSNDSSDDSSTTKDKHERQKTKNQHKNKKTEKSRVRDEDSSSEGSEDEAQKERRTHRRKRRKADSHRGSESGPDSKKRRRKDWKAACEESSSSTD